MKVLFIGGTGQISKAVSKLCAEKDIDLYLFNRGNNNHLVPSNVTKIVGDINNETEVIELLKGHSFDCVVDWVAFTKEHVERDYRLFNGITKQFVFISSASAYRKPVLDYPITEDTPLENPYWQYSRDKIACETYLNSVNCKDFNVTIVRPSHTYDDNKLMIIIKTWGGEYGHIDRLLSGKQIIIPGDGTSLWTITHNTDFAEAFVPIIGNELTYGETYHITSDKVYTWERMNQIISDALGVTPNVIHIPTDFILKYLPELEGDLVGDKMWSAVFDNSKIKRIAPNYKSVVKYEDVAPKAVKKYLATKEWKNIDENFEKIYDEIIKDYLKIV